MKTRHSVPAGNVFTVSVSQGTVQVSQLADASIGAIVTDTDTFGPYMVDHDFIVTRGASDKYTVALSAEDMLSAVGDSVSIALAASATTDGMDITITVQDAAGNTLAAAHNLDIWISESAAGLGLTADTYSGDLTAGTGAILSAHTAKKHWSVVTAETGIFVATLVDSANPTDQYVAVRNPFNGKIVVSGASGTNWEGAA